MRKLTILWTRHLNVKYPDRNETTSTNVEVNPSGKVFIDQLGFDF